MICSFCLDTPARFWVFRCKFTSLVAAFTFQTAKVDQFDAATQVFISHHWKKLFALYDIHVPLDCLVLAPAGFSY